MLIAGCGARSGSTPTSSVTKPSGIACSDLVAEAMTSPNGTVVGAFACLTSRAVTEVAAANPPITDDVTLQAYAASKPVFTRAAYFGTVQAQGEDVIVYRLSNPVTKDAECLGLFLTATEPRQVDYVAFRNISTGLC